MALLNVRSLRNKLHELGDVVHKNSFDVFAITETWLNDSIDDKELALPNYRLFRRDRSYSGSTAPSFTHGGVCVYVRDNLDVTPVDNVGHSDLELLVLHLQCSRHRGPLTICCVYRPPSAPSCFWPALESAFEGLESEEIILLGDLNVNVLCPEDRQVHCLKSFMGPLGLHNTVTSPTRTTAKSSSCLDLVLTNSVSHFSTKVEECCFSDHDLVISAFRFSSAVSRRTPCIVTRRDFRHFNVEEFRRLLVSSDLSELESSAEPDEMWTVWKDKYQSALNALAPAKLSRPRRKMCPFMSPALLSIIHERKRLYKQLHRPGADRSALYPQYRHLRTLGNNLYRQLRNKYYESCCVKYEIGRASCRERV